MFSVLVGILLAVGLVFVVFGQEGMPGAVTGEGKSAVLTVQQTFPVSASVTVDVNGEVYLLTVPAMISVDTQALLADAAVSSPSVSRVGVLNWVIAGIDEYAEEYVYRES